MLILIFKMLSCALRFIIGWVGVSALSTDVVAKRWFAEFSVALDSALSWRRFMLSDTCSNTRCRIAFLLRVSAWTLTLTQSVSSSLAVDYAIWFAVLAATLGAA